MFVIIVFRLRMAEGRVVDKALIDYVLLPRRMLGRLFMIYDGL